MPETFTLSVVFINKSGGKEREKSHCAAINSAFFTKIFSLKNFFSSLKCDKAFGVEEELRRRKRV